MPSVTITFMNSEGLRLAAALGYNGSLDAAALEFLKQDIISRYKTIVRVHESEEEFSTIMDSITDVQLT